MAKTENILLTGFGTMPDGGGFLVGASQVKSFNPAAETVEFEATVDELATRLEAIAADLRAGKLPNAGALETTHGIEVIFDSSVHPE